MSRRRGAPQMSCGCYFVAFSKGDSEISKRHVRSHGLVPLVYFLLLTGYQASGAHPGGAAHAAHGSRRAGVAPAPHHEGRKSQSLCSSRGRHAVLPTVSAGDKGSSRADELVGDCAQMPTGAARQEKVNRSLTERDHAYCVGKDHGLESTPVLCNLLPRACVR
jgi:hypothetical protein